MWQASLSLRYTPKLAIPCGLHHSVAYRYFLSEELLAQHESSTTHQYRLAVGTPDADENAKQVERTRKLNTIMVGRVQVKSGTVQKM